MSASDWTQIDSTNVELNSNNEVSTDLFGGDLFGDELLEMYSAGVNDENNGVGSIPNEIPSLMSMTKTVDETSGSAIASTPSNKEPFANDNGGLVTWTQSPSLNDLSSLLSSPPPAVANTAPTVKVEESKPIQQPPQPQAAPVQVKSEPVPAVTITNTTTAKTASAPSTKKRASSSKSQTTSNKRRASNGSKGRSSKKAEAKKVANVKAEDKDTPDPLTSTSVENVAMPQAAPATVPHVPVSNTVVQVANVKSAPIVSPTATVNSTPPPPVTVPTVQPPEVPSAALTPTGEGTKTEESFKGVAQAAVTNLILSAGNNTPRFDSGQTVTDSDSESSLHLKPVNTSTQHVTALTSNNWVAACAASICNAPAGTVAAAQAAALAAASDPAAAKAARARRATLSADERAKQNRDRNREHARNTRLRKKAYVEELKRTLTELVAQRDASDLERRHERQRDLEVREVRYRVMEEFLKLRARGNESNLLARWVAILEDGFVLTLPVTEFRQMVENDTVLTRQVTAGNLQDATSLQTPRSDKKTLMGATECLEDSSKVSLFVNSLVLNNNGAANNVRMSYHCDRKDFMMDGVNAILNWTMSTTGLVALGAKSELVVEGCMRATFSPASNKLICSELLFDTGCVTSQIKTINADTHINQVTSATNDLLDSVLPQVTTVKTDPLGMSSTIAIISNDKGESSSDEEGPGPTQQHMVTTS